MQAELDSIVCLSLQYSIVVSADADELHFLMLILTLKATPTKWCGSSTIGLRYRSVTYRNDTVDGIGRGDENKVKGHWHFGSGYRQKTERAARQSAHMHAIRFCVLHSVQMVLKERA